uniref:Cryptochrome DASH n=1 Tax=Lingulaulax polyedra TaxID=160621 RepID=A0A516AG64_LINPO|nr:cryptochrome DASH [Lingulodinium polyedra]
MPARARWKPVLVGSEPVAADGAKAVGGEKDEDSAGHPVAAAPEAGRAATGCSASDGPVFVVWHKCSDLRLQDHEPTVRAHRRAGHAQGGCVLHLHLVEQEYLLGRTRLAGLPRCGERRACFWRGCIDDLAGQLRQRGQDLLVCHDGPDGAAAFFARLCGLLQVHAVFAHRELCDEEIQVEGQVRDALAKLGVALETCWGGLTVHHIEDLCFDAADRRQMPPYKGEFFKAVRRCKVRQPMPVPSAIAPPPALLPILSLGHRGSEGGALELLRSLGAPTCWTPPQDGVGRAQDVAWDGGETAALQRLHHYVWEMDGLRGYVGATESFMHGDQNAVNAGTHLSPWLAFGCISARAVVCEARAYERARGKCDGAQRVYKELVFRDYFRFSLLTWGSRIFHLKGPFGTVGLEWRSDRELFRRWQRGETGFPFVDAGMRELAATGWISHLHRQCCAAFLVRDLRLDWRMGAEHFESLLLDHTPDANYGNWSYRILQRPCLVAGGCPVTEHLTTLEVIAWPVVHDAFLEHTLAWLPELRGLPRDLAREPWRLEAKAGRRVSVAQYKDSPLWFCSANRVNWKYEYSWLCGHAWTVDSSGGGCGGGRDFRLGVHYPRPMVPPLNLEVDMDRLPVRHGWGDTPKGDRPHVWGRPGLAVGHSFYPPAREGRNVDAGEMKEAEGRDSGATTQGAVAKAAKPSGRRWSAGEGAKKRGPPWQGA